jgi:hypothetical protein
MIAPWMEARCHEVCAWYHNTPVWLRSWNLHIHPLSQALLSS